MRNVLSDEQTYLDAGFLDAVDSEEASPLPETQCTGTPVNWCGDLFVVVIATCVAPDKDTSIFL